MIIYLKEISIREITNGYIDTQEEGVVGYGGLLNIRPKYQREFIYDDKKRDAVIDTIIQGYPLNVMYWVKNSDGSFELMDGQQRTVSFCQYVNNDFSLNDRAFFNLTTPEKDKILNYRCMIYICEGNEDEKLAWFRIINIAGVRLTDQELRNAMYTGPWLTDAKKHFSKTGCAGYNLANKYVTGNPIRQEYLEKAIEWKIDSESLPTIEKYMSIHQGDINANELWLYFLAVIEWIKVIFPKYQNEMKGIEWGILYNKFHSTMYDSKKMEKQIALLRIDDEVTNKKGIYAFLLSGDERTLNLRPFTQSQKIEMYERQKGICPACHKRYVYEQMEGDHIKPWHLGGKTDISNGQMLCIDCNRTKSGK
jgi:5-methylcytosine-specific restriction endonuclease McrA